MDVTLRDALNDWSAEQLGNLGSLLGLSDERHTIDEIEEQFKWLYHSKTRAHVKSAAQNASGFIRSVFEKSEHQSAEVESAYEIPSYFLLISELAEKLDVKEDLASLADCEEFISHAVILKALQEMSPNQRRDFFNQPINTDEFCESSGMDNESLTGPVTTVAALGAANAAGFSLYMASTTALGFVTHAVGITLPFAAYTGLTSTVAFLIGPAGFLAASGWAVWKITEPSWKQLTPALLYIISVKSLATVKIV